MIKPGALLLFTFLSLLGAGVFPDAAHATREGRSLATDRRIQTIMYSTDEVYKFTGNYGYQSAIEFATDEEIQTISMGDSTSWLLEPSGNRIFLKPIEKEAVTNMTVLTNKRSYIFELHAREASGIDDPKLVFQLRFMYPTDNNDYISTTAPTEGVPDLEDPEERSKLNFNYSLRGKEIISPLRILDDGEFTYFEFRNKNADVPAFFLVDSDGKEALINYRVRGDYIVIERVWGVFTLRHGSDVVCVYNESWNPGRGLNVAGNTRLRDRSPQANGGALPPGKTSGGSMSGGGNPPSALASPDATAVGAR